MWRVCWIWTILELRIIKWSLSALAVTSFVLTLGHDVHANAQSNPFWVRRFWWKLTSSWLRWMHFTVLLVLLSQRPVAAFCLWCWDNSRPCFSSGRPCLHASARLWRRTEHQRWHPCWRDIWCTWGTLKESLSVLLSLLVSGVPRGGGAAGCSDLRSPQAPTLTVPDAQMGWTVSLSAPGAEEANSLIWSLLMESLEGASYLTCLRLPFSPLPCSLIESFHWCLWQNKVPLGKERERVRDWERETKNSS